MEFEQQSEKWREEDMIDNVQSDIDDLMSGRIKDIEHLESISTLLDKLVDLSSNIDHIIELNQKEMYDLINSKSLAELHSVFEKLDDFKNWFDKNFGISKN